ncbi:hypothetical protein PSFL111601_03600 [Pseudomonas floridensis]
MRAIASNQRSSTQDFISLKQRKIKKRPGKKPGQKP